MKSILLIGLGRFGKHIAMKLNEMNHQVMAIDNDEKRINDVLNYVTYAQIGDSTDSHFLASLGIPSFDACIITIGDNFQNSLETTYLLHELGARKIIARASKEMQEQFLLRNGADEVVYPEKQLGTWTAIRCSSEHILDYIELDKNHAIYELAIPVEWAGQTILQLDVRRKYGINILGIRKDGQLDMNFTADTVLSRCQSVLVLGTENNIQKCFRI